MSLVVLSVFIVWDQLGLALLYASIHKTTGIYVRVPSIVHIHLLYTRKLGLLN